MTVFVVLLGSVVVVALISPFVAYTILGPVLDRRRRIRNDEMAFDYYCAKGVLHRFMRLNRLIPAAPRCKLCYVPFGGLGRALGIRPSRKNSNFCRSCFETTPEGGYEREIGVLFADLRGFTAWSGDRSPDDVAASLAQFYRLAADALMAHDAIVDKFVGDQVMALFLTDMPSLGGRTCDEMVAAASQLLVGARALDSLQVGIGVHYGRAWVGNVGDGAMKDFTALGDVVNVAARLQGCAKPGELVISEEVFGRLHEPITAIATSFEVKGKPNPVAARIIAPTPQRA